MKTATAIEKKHLSKIMRRIKFPGIFRYKQITQSRPDDRTKNFKTCYLENFAVPAGHRVETLPSRLGLLNTSTTSLPTSVLVMTLNNYRNAGALGITEYSFIAIALWP